MNDNLEQRLSDAPIIPIVSESKAPDAVAVSRALSAGGLEVVEVVLRSDDALDCLREVVNQVPEAVVGVGTVLTVSQAEAAVACGAKFIVSPGLDVGVVQFAQSRKVPIYPGTVTASEIQHAYNLGLREVKFFPASISGGIAAIKAFASVFRSMRFMPTGGVNEGNLADYLSIPEVLACGGSWLTPSSAVASGDFESITRLAEAAVDIARGQRKSER